MEAGRKLDAEIAERVVGWTRHPNEMHPSDNRAIGGVLYCPPGCPWDGNSMNVVPCYSTDIAAAMTVFDMFPVIVVQRATAPEGGRVGYLCSLPLEPNDPRRRGQTRTTLDEEADTAALAICRAALKAVRGGVTN